MKKIRVNTVVYDRTTREYIQKSVSRPISDELAAMIQKEFRESDLSSYEVHGFGTREAGNGKIPGLRTPLASQKRFWIDPQFYVLDEDDSEIAGWRGL